MGPMNENEIEREVNSTREIGGPVGASPNPLRHWVPGAPAAVAENLEKNWELRFPQSVEVFEQMSKTDTKIGSILRAITLQLRKSPWHLQGDEVRPEVLKFVERNISLKSSKGRTRTPHKGIIFDEHLRELLSYIHNGFSAFEVVYSIDRPRTPEEEALGLPWIGHLRKLAARDASTIESINVDDDGGLAGITQRKLDPTKGTESLVHIPVSQLVLYVNDRRGADWYGVSILREAYGDWYLKNQLVRINAQAIERNGMGFPVVTYDPGVMDESQALRLATDARAGARVGAAMPVGSSLKFEGVTGGVRDALPSIKHHNEEISRAVLAMFLDLGHDAGARSLGDTFVDLFLDSIEAVAEHIAEVFTEHVIRDLVAYNFGPDEKYPVLSPGAVSASRNVAPETLKTLIDSGIIKPTVADEKHFRIKYGLPEVKDADLKDARKPAPVIVQAPADGEAQAPATGPDDKKSPPVDNPVDNETQLSEGRTHYDIAEELMQSINAARAERDNV